VHSKQLEPFPEVAPQIWAGQQLSNLCRLLEVNGFWRQAGKVRHDDPEELQNSHHASGHDDKGEEGEFDRLFHDKGLWLTLGSMTGNGTSENGVTMYLAR
jgi:hypothetical protein